MITTISENATWTIERGDTITADGVPVFKIDLCEGISPALGQGVIKQVQALLSAKDMNDLATCFHIPS